jgi:hypothetical protein
MAAFTVQPQIRLSYAPPALELPERAIERSSPTQHSLVSIAHYKAQPQFSPPGDSLCQASGHLDQAREQCET